MIYNYKTKNNRILKLVEILKSMNVKNYEFLLELYDERLIDIDPFDKNLSEENKELVIKEIQTNIWYFIREIIYLYGDIMLSEIVTLLLLKNNLNGLYIYNTKFITEKVFRVYYLYLLIKDNNFDINITIPRDVKNITRNYNFPKYIEEKIKINKNLKSEIVLNNSKITYSYILKDFEYAFCGRSCNYFVGIDCQRYKDLEQYMNKVIPIINNHKNKKNNHGIHLQIFSSYPFKKNDKNKYLHKMYEEAEVFNFETFDKIKEKEINEFYRVEIDYFNRNEFFENPNNKKGN